MTELCKSFWHFATSNCQENKHASNDKRKFEAYNSHVLNQLEPLLDSHLQLLQKIGKTSLSLLTELVIY